MTEKTSSQRVIMGIDPGTNLLGYGILLVDGRRVHYVDMGVVDMRKMKDPFAKIGRIYEEVGALMDRYNPDDIAVESPFYGINPQVLLKLGRAQGAAIGAAVSRGLPVFEYAPRKAKMSITGVGNASKEQVMVMLGKILKIEMDNKYLDASDALAIAYCHYNQLTNPLADTSASSSWEKFVAAHPDKVK